MLIINGFLEENNKLTDKYLRDIMINFIIAGRDTTAQSLSWSMYRLCIHSNIQLKIYNEIKEILINENQWPTFDDLKKMKYLEAFCLEVS